MLCIELKKNQGVKNSTLVTRYCLEYELFTLVNCPPPPDLAQTPVLNPQPSPIFPRTPPPKPGPDAPLNHNLVLTPPPTWFPTRPQLPHPDPPSVSEVHFNFTWLEFNLTSLLPPLKNNIFHLAWKNSQNNREATLFPSIRYSTSHQKNV